MIIHIASLVCKKLVHHFSCNGFLAGHYPFIFNARILPSSCFKVLGFVYPHRVVDLLRLPEFEFRLEPHNVRYHERAVPPRPRLCNVQTFYLLNFIPGNVQFFLDFSVHGLVSRFHRLDEPRYVCVYVLPTMAYQHLVLERDHCNYGRLDLRV